MDSNKLYISIHVKLFIFCTTRSGALHYLTGGTHNLPTKKRKVIFHELSTRRSKNRIFRPKSMVGGCQTPHTHPPINPALCLFTSFVSYYPVMAQNCFVLESLFIRFTILPLIHPKKRSSYIILIDIYIYICISSYRLTQRYQYKQTLTRISKHLKKRFEKNHRVQNTPVPASTGYRPAESLIISICVVFC